MPEASASRSGASSSSDHRGASSNSDGALEPRVSHFLLVNGGAAKASDAQAHELRSAVENLLSPPPLNAHQLCRLERPSPVRCAGTLRHDAAKY